MASIYIGLSGYSYKAWKGLNRFYPATLKQSDFLAYYATRYNTVELDGTWYRLPSVDTVQAWVQDTPETFVLSPKAHRQITHFKRLTPEALPILESMLQRLAPLSKRQKLGPILVQLPPNFKADLTRLSTFLTALPPLHRWAIEFRHSSWHAAEVEALLRRHGVAWAAVDTDENEAQHRNTADFAYVRLRRSTYGLKDLQGWADRIKEKLQNGIACYVYCKHDDEGSPWVWADQLTKLTNR